MKTQTWQRPDMLVLIVLLLPFAVYTKVFWRLVTNPVIIDEDVELFCNLSASSCQGCAKAWFQNRNRVLLAFHDSTSDPRKYNIRLSNYGFSLIIKQFSERDINSSFTCVYGPDAYERILTVGNNFEKIPKENDIFKSKTLIDGRRLEINLHFLEVHPVPSCSVFLVNKTLTQNLNVITYNNTRSGLYYNVSFDFSYDGNCHDSGTFKVHCSIGTFNMQAWETDVSFECKDSQLPDTNTVVMISISGVLVLFMICSSLILFLRRTQRYRNVLMCYLRRTKNKNLIGNKEIPNDTFELVHLLNNENDESNNIYNTGNILELTSNIYGNSILRRRHKRKDEQVKTEATIEYLNESKEPTYISNNMFSFFDWTGIRRYSETEVVTKPTGNHRKRRRLLLDIHDKKNK